MNTKKFQFSSISPFIAASVIIVFLVIVLKLFFIVRFDGDARWYAAMAKGRINEVIKPFSGRFLHPFLAGWLSHYFQLDLGISFFILDIFSLFLFFLAIFLIFKKSVNSLFLIIPLFLLPYFPSALNEIFLPDIFYIFLTALFFLFLFYKKEALSLIILFSLFLARESTIILALILIILSWLHSKKLLAIATLCVIGISFFITGSISNIGQPDIHGLSGPVYIVFKFAYNFMVNVFGARFWVNTYHTCEPIFKFFLPHAKLFGNIREAGFCGFDFSLPINTLVTLLTIFGIAPLIFFYVFKTRLKDVFKDFPFWILVAVVYGVAHYFLGIVAGTGVWRIVGYSWPAFLLTTPIFTRKFFNINKKIIIKLSLIHLFVAWLPFIIQQIIGNTNLGGILIIFVVLAFYLYALKIIKRCAKKSIREEKFSF